MRTEGARGEEVASRRAELVGIAAGLFREKGYHAVGMRAIGDAGRIRAASLYHHFGSKEDLLYEAVSSVNRDFIDPALRLLDDESTSYRDRLASVVRAHVLHIGRHRDAWWLTTRELRALSADRFEQVQSDRRRYQHRIAEHIASGVQAGEFDCADPRVTALAVLDVLNGFNEWFEESGRVGIERLAELYVDLACRAVGAAPGPGRDGTTVSQEADQ